MFLESFKILILVALGDAQGGIQARGPSADRLHRGRLLEGAGQVDQGVGRPDHQDEACRRYRRTSHHRQRTPILNQDESGNGLSQEHGWTETDLKLEYEK